MKNIILILSLFIASILSMNGQVIASDIQRGDYRAVATSVDTYATTKGLIKGQLKVAFMAICTEQDTIYKITPEITLYEPITIDKFSKMILKLKDGRVITIETVNGVDVADYQYKVTEIGTFYYIYPSYTITKEDLDLLINNECTKFRMECNTGRGYFEFGKDNKKLKKFKLSEVIAKQYKLVKERLKVGNSLYDNF